METKLTPAELEAGLAQFYGTQSYWRHLGPIVMTDGAKYLADHAGCYWLYDIVFSVLPKLRGEGFCAVHLTVNLPNHVGRVVIEDGNERVLYEQRIPYTDFPLDEITLFLEDGEVGGKPAKVLLLPSEH